MTLSPESISFGSQTLDVQSAVKTVTFSNTGTTPLSINTINYAGDFHLSNNCPDTLGAGESCLIWTTFTPRALGALTGSFTMHCSSAGVAMPAESVALTGTGVD
jgi:hypothetical protein